MILFHIFIFSKYVYLLPFNFTFPNLFIIFICLYSLSFSAQIKTDSPFPVLSVFGDPGEIRTPDTLIRSQVLYPAELLGRIWQGQRDSNPQPTVLETVALSIALCPYIHM